MSASLVSAELARIRPEDSATGQSRPPRLDRPGRRRAACDWPALSRMGQRAPLSPRDEHQGRAGELSVEDVRTGRTFKTTPPVEHAASLAGFDEMR
jgi:hypothetical protein